MRRLLWLVFFAASASLVLAQHQGEGGEEGAPPENGTQIPCFLGFELPPDLVNIFKSCGESVVPEVYAKYADSPELEYRVELAMANCILTTGGFALDNGLLDIDKILKTIDNLQSSVFLARKRLISMGHLCMLNVSSDSGTEGFLRYTNCVTNEADGYCALQREKLKAYWQMANQTSPCASVQFPKEYYEINDTCFAITRPTHHARGCRDHVHSRSREHSPPHGDSTHKSQSLQEEMALQLCVDEALGTYSPDSGYNYSRLIENINNLTGWEGIPEILTNVTMAMESCIPKYEGDLLAQMWQWESCVTLPVIDMCGFDNAVTSMINHELEKEMALYAKGVADLRSGRDGGM